MPLPPIVQEAYTPDQLRYIAGYLLHYRAGILQALQSVRDDAAKQIPDWQDPQIRYYRDAEAVTRFLLYHAGYPVLRDQLYEGEIDYHYRTIDLGGSPGG